MDIEYVVEGRRFNNPDAAEEYARHVALRDERAVHIMEKVDGLPWARVATITDE